MFVFFVLQLLDVDPQDNVCLYLFDVPCTQFRRYTDHNTRKNIVQSIDGMKKEIAGWCCFSSQSSFVPGRREAAGFFKIKYDLL